MISHTRISRKAESFTESVIREMNRVAVMHGAVSLAQGFPDFACPPELKRAVAEAVDAELNQYAITWGSKLLRDAIATSTPRHFPGFGEIDPETQVTVTCGATEAMIAAMLGLLDPGDEVIVFEPYYENYGPDAILSGAVPRYVTLHEPDWSIDPDQLRGAFGPRTRGLVLNSPHNPTGKVFTRDELELIAALCMERDVIAFTDDIYEHLVYEGEHIPLATLPGMAERTVSIHSMSKTYSVTGWRIGWAIASPELSLGIRRVHDFLTVGTAAPLQAAATTALHFPDGYYRELVAEYRERRAVLLPVSAPFHCALMAPAQERMAADLSRIPFRDPEVPLVNNVDARTVRAADECREGLVRQVSAPVRWHEVVNRLASAGVRAYVEVGPGTVLSGLVRKIHRDARIANLASPEDLETVEALVRETV